MNPNINVNNLRLYFGGSELKDHELIYQHNIKDNYTLNLVIRRSG